MLFHNSNTCVMLTYKLFIKDNAIKMRVSTIMAVVSDDV